MSTADGVDVARMDLVRKMLFNMGEYELALVVARGKLRPQLPNLFAQRLQLKQVQLKLRALHLRHLAARIRSEIFALG